MNIFKDICILIYKYKCTQMHTYHGVIHYRPLDRDNSGLILQTGHFNGNIIFRNRNSFRETDFDQEKKIKEQMKIISLRRNISKFSNFIVRQNFYKIHYGIKIICDSFRPGVYASILDTFEKIN